MACVRICVGYRHNTVHKMFILGCHKPGTGLQSQYKTISMRIARGHVFRISGDVRPHRFNFKYTKYDGSAYTYITKPMYVYDDDDETSPCSTSSIYVCLYTKIIIITKLDIFCQLSINGCIEIKM